MEDKEICEMIQENDSIDPLNFIQIRDDQLFKFRAPNQGECKRVIKNKAVLVEITPDANAMFYHFNQWHSEFFNWYLDNIGDNREEENQNQNQEVILGKEDREKRRRGILKNQQVVDHNRHVHLILKGNPRTTFLDSFMLESDFCWRRLSNLPPDTCFEEVLEAPGFIGSSAIDWEKRVVNNWVQLLNIPPNIPIDKPRLGIISRRRKRFILNEEEIIKLGQDMGYEVHVLPLESMTLFEQIQMFQRMTVLVGIHGSGLRFE